MFEGCKTTDDIRKEYRNLARKNHPDLGGSTAVMQQINAKYAYLIDRARRADRPELHETEYSNMANIDEAIRQAIDAIINLDGLDIEICGLWVWVGGNTRTHKEALKAAAYRWAPKKQRWYFAGIPSSGVGKTTMTDIRNIYGSTKVIRRKNRY